jgi:hypothetical protein
LYDLPANHTISQRAFPHLDDLPERDEFLCGTLPPILITTNSLFDELLNVWLKRNTTLIGFKQKRTLNTTGSNFKL